MRAGGGGGEKRATWGGAPGGGGGGGGGGERTKANLGIMRPTTGRSLSRSHYHKMPGCTADPRLDGIGCYYIAGY